MTVTPNVVFLAHSFLLVVPRVKKFASEISFFDMAECQIYGYLEMRSINHIEKTGCGCCG